MDINLPLVILLFHLIQHVVFAIAGTFLYHVDHFRQYSTFCASLHKLKDILGELQHRYIVVDSRVEGHCLLHYYLATYQCKFFIFFSAKTIMVRIMTILTSTALHFMMVVTVTIPYFFAMCLARQDNTQLHNYLEARNPKKDSTLNLNALLAKPIVVRCK